MKRFDSGDMTKEDILNRIHMLADEIDANEMENRFYQDEIDTLYLMLGQMENK